MPAPGVRKNCRVNSGLRKYFLGEYKHHKMFTELFGYRANGLIVPRILIFIQAGILVHGAAS